MSIQFTCPHCGAATIVAEQYVGQTGPCIRCGKQITVPSPDGASPFAGGGHAPRRGLGAGITCLIVLAVAIPMVLFIGGILVALLLPAVQAAREAARRMQCTNNMKQICLAIHNYAQVYRCFPPAFIADEDGKPMHSWRVLILPFLEQQDLYSQYRFDEPWDSSHNFALADKMPSVYRCPTSGITEPSQTSYAMIVGPHAFSDGSTPRTFTDITDGLSNTIMVAECAGAGINWLEPRDLNTEEMTFYIQNRWDNSQPRVTDISSEHIGTANVGFCDGSVRSLSTDLDPKTLEALTTIDGGEKEVHLDFP